MPFLEIGEDVIAIHSIGVHKVVSFLSHGEAIFPIVNLVLICRVPIVIGVHLLYQALFLRVQHIYIPVIFDDIRELLG